MAHIPGCLRCHYESYRAGSTIRDESTDLSCVGKFKLYLTFAVFCLSSPEDLTAGSCQVLCMKSCCRKLASSPPSGVNFGILLCVCLQMCVWLVLFKPRCVTQLGVAVVRLVFKAPQPEGGVTHLHEHTKTGIQRLCPKGLLLS